MQTVGIHLRGHSQEHEESDEQVLTQGAEINHSHSHIHSIDLPNSAEEGTLSCNQIASLSKMVLGMSSSGTQSREIAEDNHMKNIKGARTGPCTSALPLEVMADMGKALSFDISQAWSLQQDNLHCH